VFAQQRNQFGTIKGRVVEKATRSPLPGANVTLAGTSTGSITDLNGEYIISKVPEGNYTFVITYIGYKDFKKTISVEGGKEIQQNAELEWAAIEGEEVTITAQARGQLGAINQQLAAKTITNVVSKARIEEIPDANAAESVGRLPGVSIVRSGGEGSQVVIRGMEPKLNLITVNGVRMPSTEFGERSVDLGMISSNMLDGIEVTKALTADQDGDAVGGIVDLKLKGADDKRQFNVMLLKGYASQENTFSPIKGNLNYSDRYFGKKLGLVVSGNYEMADRSSDQFSAGYSVQGDPRPGETYRDILTERVTLSDVQNTRQRMGGSLLLDYKFDQGLITFNNIASRLINETVHRDDQVSLAGRQRYYQLDRNDLGTDFLSNSLNGKFSLWGSQLNLLVSHSFSHSGYNDFPSYTMQFTEFAAYDGPMDQGPKAVFSNTNDQLEMTGLEKVVIDPEESTERDWLAQLDWEIPVLISNQITGEIKFGGKYRYKDRQADREGYESVLRWYPQIYQDSNFPQIYVPGDRMPSILPYLDEDYNTAGEFLNDEYPFRVGLDKDMLHDLYTTVFLAEMYDANYRFTYKPTFNLDDQNIQERISAGYVMGTFHFGKRLMFIPGVRYEQETTDMVGVQFKGSVVTVPGVNPAEFFKNDPNVLWPQETRSHTHWLPMIHLRYYFTDWLDLRLASTKTLNRPSFHITNPSMRIDDNGKTVRRGSPDLKPSVSQNFDASLSAYSNRLGLVTVSGFYKEIDDLYYQFQRTLMSEEDVIDAGFSDGRSDIYVGYKLTDYINNPHTAYVRGIEVDLQTQFSFLPGALKGIVLNVNYSRIGSEAKYPYSVLEKTILDEYPFVETTRKDTSRSGRMLRQSNDIANVSLGYDYKGFSARVSMLYQGNTLSRIGNRIELDGFTEDYIRFDLSVKQKIGSHIEVFLNANNLTNRPDRSYEPVNHYMTSSQYYGMTADIGLRYRL
jgi:TonB-dependent receptor